ncbi:protein of unknown function [Methylocella tundrae]|uniref:Uncharacterized protein n=1 Tax=Methylocella tundrae TaxID=227605 RepID=A0A4U8Z1T4_METTU|nr:protein of unknown function [Methylocella tundrae]
MNFPMPPGSSLRAALFSSERGLFYIALSNIGASRVRSIVLFIYLDRYIARTANCAG